MFIRLLTILFLSIVLAGCAGNPAQEQQTNPYEQFVQQQKLVPVAKVQTFRLSGWHALDDQWLQVESAPSKPYLLHLSVPCTELKWANYLMVNQTMPNVLQAKFDTVRVPGSQEIRCTIDEIYPLNKTQWQALQKLK